MAAGENTIITLDMNLEDYADFEPLPKGPYVGECILAEVRVSANGNSYFYTNWKITPDQFPVDYDIANAPEGLQLNYSRVQVPTPDDRRSITQVKHFMAALGTKLKTKVIDPSSWVGKKAKLILGQEMYNGENRNSITGVESLEA